MLKEIKVGEIWTQKYRFEPDEDEKTFFISKMEERCMKLYGESLMEFYKNRAW